MGNNVLISDQVTPSVWDGTQSGIILFSLAAWDAGAMVAKQKLASATFVKIKEAESSPQPFRSQFYLLIYTYTK